MRTTPKYFLILALTAGAVLVAESCASDGPSTAPLRQDPRIAQEKLQDLHAKHDWIGKYHTDGLAYIYTQLSKGNGKSRTHADMCKIVAKATKEFHKAQRHAEVPAGLVDASLVNEVCPLDDGNNVISKTVLTPGISGTPRKFALSATATNLINQIVYLSSSATSRYALVNGILSIESQVGGLPGDEAGAVIGVASIALSSLDYWEANLDSWVTLPGTKAVSYSVSARDMTSATVLSTAAPVIGPRFGKWWQNPYVKGFGKVLGADGMAAARTIYIAWELGPIGWDAAAASALFASGTTALALIF